jgi:hypothetical protein
MIMLPIVLYGGVIWLLTLREEHRLRVYDNVLKRIFGPKKVEVTGSGENYVMSLMICTPHPILFRLSI